MWLGPLYFDCYPVFRLFFPTSVWGLKLLVYTELQWIQSVQSKSSCDSCNSFLLTSCHCSIDVLLSWRFSNFCRLLSRVWAGSSVSTSRWNVCSCWHVLSCWSSVCFFWHGTWTSLNVSSWIDTDTTQKTHTRLLCSVYCTSNRNVHTSGVSLPLSFPDITWPLPIHFIMNQ
jgi:hypothetical protein